MFPCYRALVGPGITRRVIRQVKGLGARFAFFELAEVQLDLDLLEAVLGVARRTATDDALSEPFPTLHPPILAANSGPLIVYFSDLLYRYRSGRG